MLLQLCHTLILSGVILLINALKVPEMETLWLQVPLLTMAFQPYMLLQIRPLTLTISGGFVCAVAM